MSLPLSGQSSDGDLIQLIVEQKDRGAATALWDRYASQLRGIVVNTIATYEKTLVQVEDCLQELFLTLLDGLGGFDRSRPFAPYVNVIARHLASKLARLMQGHSVDFSTTRSADAEDDVFDLFSELSASLTSPSHAISRQEARDLVTAKLAELRPIDREALRLKYFEEMSDSAAAETLGVGRTVYLMRVLRAREKMKAMLLPQLHASWFESA